MPDITIILIIAAAVILTAVIASLATAQRMRRKVNYMLDALEDKELNFRFDEKRLRDRRFNKTLNRLRNIFDKERREIMEQEKYFGQMLDHVKTGIAVVEDDGRINYCNRTALALLGVATFSHIRQLKTINESLYQAFETITDESELKASYYNERGKITISLTASETSIGKETVRIIAFNDISNDIAENEQQSWSKLIRVLTHEIMNTVTPISSLSETLLTLENVNEEVKNGLSTILQASKSLIRFVESYRNLTRIAPPVRKAFYLKDLVENVLKLTSEQALAEGVSCSFIENSHDIILYADEGQITQIFINLIKNAIQAEAGKIMISAEITPSEQTVINITNDGHPISKESQEEIFVPFYTTKQEGTGIGLSLSRQIMRMHNGSLVLTRSDSRGTVFTLVFR
ncbi:MAG: PAS domain-containing sensor histidine kinase [Bacteroidales bacterium]|nr:PAS domain-containing sensor histidine kinase [Bacteroidales bacterium]